MKFSIAEIAQNYSVMKRLKWRDFTRQTLMELEDFLRDFILAVGDRRALKRLYEDNLKHA